MRKVKIDDPLRDTDRLKIVLAAGGSGGHIFPCVSLASELEKAGVRDIFFVSSKRRLDINLLKDVPFPRFYLSINPMPRSFSPIKILVFAAKCAADLVRSFFIILRIRPDVVVGFGGYSSGTISLMARAIGTPLIIHEQNIVPGRANLILSCFAGKIAVSFADSPRYFGKYAEKTVFTGNPIRTNILTNDRKASAARLGVSAEKLTVLVMGGSQGSRFLNRIMLQVASEIRIARADAIQFVHITGQGDGSAEVTDFYEKNSIAGKVFAFMDRIDDAYSVSDIVVSRSGAAAIFELAYYAKPMILVPYPNPKNNQRSNAVFFSSAGAAILREEKDLSCETLKRDILGILDDPKRLSSMRAAALKLAFPESGRVLAGEVLKTARSRT